MAGRLEGTHVPKGIVTKALSQHRVLRAELREAHSVVDCDGGGFDEGVEEVVS